jgi:hypothetical protein
LRLLPPSGIPYGNLSYKEEDSDYCYLDGYYYPVSGDCSGGQQSCGDFPPCSGSSSFALYDRWGDYHNVNREFVTYQIARALGAAVYLHSLSGATYQPWKKADGTINIVSGGTLNSSTVVRLDCSDPTVDLNQAQIVWDAEFESRPAFGRSFTLKPRPDAGETLVEAEAVMPDGRRIFGRKYLEFTNSNGSDVFASDGHTVALYRFDDNSQSTLYFKDYTANGYGLTTVAGLPALQQNNSWMQNPSGYAAEFGAIGDSIKTQTKPIPNSVLLPANPGGFTIEFRIYIKRLPNTASAALYLLRLAQTQPGDGDSSEWSVKYRTADAPFPQIMAPGHHAIVNSDEWAAKMTPNTWHLVKITAQVQNIYSADTSVYIDDMVNAVNTLHNNPQDVEGSQWILSMGDFVGCIDEVRISNVVR